MKHLIYIIILLGVVGCQAPYVTEKKPSVTVNCVSSFTGKYYVIHVGPSRWVDGYLPETNIVNWYAIRNRDSAIALAKHFDTYDKISHWNDSVRALVIPEPPLIDTCNETIPIY